MNLKRFWRFLWYDDSPLSWVANILIAFVFIKFILFPGLSLAFGSELPIVAVVSGSMEHKTVHPCYEYVLDGICVKSDKTTYEICGKAFIEKRSSSLESYWDTCGYWYEQKNISQSDFAEFSFKNGFNVGDVMLIFGKSFNSVAQGDIIVFRSRDGIPIIHRVVGITELEGVRTLQTKGDHNADSITTGPRSEIAITQDQYIGTASMRVPLLGYVKLAVVRAYVFLHGLIS